MLMGDININILDNTYTFAQEHLNSMGEFEYQSAINTYTRVQAETKTCIVYSFINFNQKITKLQQPLFIYYLNLFF